MGWEKGRSQIAIDFRAHEDAVCVWTVASSEAWLLATYTLGLRRHEHNRSDVTNQTTLVKTDVNYGTRVLEFSISSTGGTLLSFNQEGCLLCVHTYLSHWHPLLRNEPLRVHSHLRVVNHSRLPAELLVSVLLRRGAET